MFLIIITFTGWIAYQLLEHDRFPPMLSFSSTPQTGAIAREDIPQAPISLDETVQEDPEPVPDDPPVESVVEPIPPEVPEPQQPPSIQKDQAVTREFPTDNPPPGGTNTTTDTESAEKTISDESGGMILPDSMASSEPGSRELQLALNSVVADRTTAMARLLTRWNLIYPGGGNDDPCLFARTKNLRCRNLTGEWDLIRHYDRPALIRIDGDSGPLGFVLLHSLDQEYALLDLGDGKSASMPLAWLARHWAGDFEILWQPPPGGDTLISRRSARHYIQWLRQTLSRIPGYDSGDPSSGTFDDGLKGEILRFQRHYGLTLDGLVGPETLIALNTAAALPGIPRLSRAN
jgi:general secretion pathway protein A